MRIKFPIVAALLGMSAITHATNYLLLMEQEMDRPSFSLGINLDASISGTYSGDRNPAGTITQPFGTTESRASTPILSPAQFKFEGKGAQWSLSGNLVADFNLDKGAVTPRHANWYLATYGDNTLSSLLSLNNPKFQTLQPTGVFEPLGSMPVGTCTLERLEFKSQGGTTGTIRYNRASKFWEFSVPLKYDVYVKLKEFPAQFKASTIITHKGRIPPTSDGRPRPIIDGGFSWAGLGSASELQLNNLPFSKRVEGGLARFLASAKGVGFGAQLKAVSSTTRVQDMSVMSRTLDNWKAR